MNIHSQTKNLAIMYQKLFNVAQKEYRKSNKSRDKYQKINVRKCSSLHSFRRLLIENGQIREIMKQMCQSGDMLKVLLKWKGAHSNLAIAIKYYNVLCNLVVNPNFVLNWKNITKKSDRPQEKECQEVFLKQTQILPNIPFLQNLSQNFEKIANHARISESLFQTNNYMNMLYKDGNKTFHNFQLPQSFYQKKSSTQSIVSFVPYIQKRNSQCQTNYK